MKPSPLSPAAVRRSVSAVIEDLGRADRKRLEALFSVLQDDGRASLGLVLSTLFPALQREAALTAFRQFRGRFGAAATESGVALSLETDSQTRAAPDERWCWFVGDDGAAKAFEQRTDAETAGFSRVGQSGAELAETRDGKPLIRYFISYAGGERNLKTALMNKLKPFLELSTEYCFEAWDDGDIPLGENWHAEIQAAIARCQFGLLLTSPLYLTRDYVTAHELPAFVAPEAGAAEPGRRAIPVAIAPLLFDGSMDLKGLGERQIFRDSDGKSFNERRIDAAKEAFARELFQRIVKVVARHVAPNPPPAGHAARASSRIELAQRRHLDAAADWDCHVPTQGFKSSVDKIESEPGPSRDPDRIDALAFLNEWASNPQAQPYFALLGDLGMGKTTTCMAFARDLLARRAADPAAPLPIYLDLRYLGDQAKQEPMLKTILDTVLARSWRGGQAEPSVGADEAIRLVQQEGAIAIFDGLDEVLVHLSKAAGQRFVREIFRILPPAGARHGAASPKAPAGKSKAGVAGRLLVACRTHYFRTLREQQNFLTAEDRDDIRPEDYRALILLPFTDEQIRDYFRHSLPDEDPDRILDLIRAVHNLSEMAERPYTLSLIARHIPQIERWKLQGRKVTGVMLYRHMVMSWLERDDGKHQILPEHKRRIMEHLAAELWRSGRRLWSVGELEQWLIDFFASAPEVAAHYGAKDRELLKEDLRTATFLVREGEDSFRFAHTSLQEFFLACYLLDALRRGTPERWQIPLPSIETLDFLGQLLLEENHAGRESCFATLRAIRDACLPQASELAFRFWLHALRKTYPVPSPAGFRLDGADLRGMDISGAPSEARINLRGASFRQARLAGATLSHLDLEGARFDGADLGRCDCVSIRAPEVVFSAALLAGAVFRQCNFAQGDFTNVAFQRTQFLHCDLRAAVGLGRRIPDVFFACCNGVEGAPQPARDSARLEMLDGHSGFVLSCAWSPDGRRLASASWDQTLRLWDAASGECLSVLRGHEAGVSACAWSPDGRRLASASWDRTLRLWNAASGECLRVLRGHDRGVSSCAWSPDSRQLASASADRTLRVWDAVRGECLRVLRGHERDVTTCAWSPESRQLASGSGDQTVRLWDAASGECLNVLRGHKSGVTTCAWSPDGRQLASASEDRTVRQWDAISGECLSVLRGHERGVTACAWSPDARKLASGARDDTVRLWDASSGDCIRVLNGHEGRVTACAFSPEGWQLASASWDQTVRLWDVVSDECLSVLRGHERGVTACAWSPDSRQLASAAWDDALHLWDAASGECLNVLRGHVAQVTACAWSPDGLQLASAAADHTLRLWAAASGECIRVLRGHGAEVATCAWLLDGRQLASASADQTVRVWDAVSGKCLSVLRGHEERVTACAWSPGGRQLASASWDKTVRLWDAASGECLSVLRSHEDSVTACAWSPDGRQLASASWDETVRLWDATSGECLSVLRSHDADVTACAWSPDGRLLASASEDQTVCLWDAAGGECLSVLRGHERGVTGCAWSPDGRQLATCAWDGSICFWDTATFQPAGLRIHQFRPAGWAAIDSQQNRVIRFGGEAWRWLRWRSLGANGQSEIWPAEVFGPLPTSVLT